MTKCIGCGKDVVKVVEKQPDTLCNDCWYLENEKNWSGC